MLIVALAVYTFAIMEEPSAQSASAIRSDRHHCPSPHSFRNKAGRAAWAVVGLLLFRPTPCWLHGWRCFLLCCFGAKIGRGVKVMPSVQVWAPWNLTIGDHSSVSHGADLYAVDRITIGAHATISQRAFLCTASHDIDHPNMPLVTAPVRIGDGVWICAEAYVHPGVVIGTDAVIAVRSVVLHDVEPRCVVGGHPAKFLRKRKVAENAGPA